ncbi:hypothetical protein F6V30_14390 [Oryzomonas sagensis]|uniref:Uncharacterized protein n=1 Tax=Oryzomonas sagensis TaxID=2603857 RepID=A0ABQ6TL73_9BACT|nr:hypothetical protein [Oryzomonas sagensis]KAB0669022.1 hypothetical protein F6V30_14390 [Oryzomonas sagensis]
MRKIIVTIVAIITIAAAAHAEQSNVYKCFGVQAVDPPVWKKIATLGLASEQTINIDTQFLVPVTVSGRDIEEAMDAQKILATEAMKLDASQIRAAQVTCTGPAGDVIHLAYDREHIGFRSRYQPAPAAAALEAAKTHAGTAYDQGVYQ